MRLGILVTLLAIIVGCTCGGCASRTPDRSETVVSAIAAMPSNGTLSAPDRQRAAQLYQQKCARCHKLYDPRAYSHSEWQSWMRKMSRKARLKPDQQELLTVFIDEFRAAAGPNPAQ